VKLNEAEDQRDHRGLEERGEDLGEAGPVLAAAVQPAGAEQEHRHRAGQRREVRRRLEEVGEIEAAADRRLEGQR
jgi:hypothetical protein